MNRSDAGMVLGLAGFLLAGGAVFYCAHAVSLVRSNVETMETVRIQDNESIGALGDRVDKLALSVKDLTDRVNRIDVDDKSARDRTKSLEDRVGELEARGGGGAEAAVATAPGKSEMSQEQFDALRRKLFGGQLSEEEQSAFWDAAKTKPELMKAIIGDLEKKVADGPRDVAARLNLADAYVARLFTATYGPEMGMWAGKAESQWKAVLDIDANHQVARFALAFSYSQYPDFLNKRPDAIREFETLRKIQEETTPHPSHARTYLQLRQLYLKEGNAEEAKKVLEEGVRRFPDDEELKKIK